MLRPRFIIDTHAVGEKDFAYPDSEERHAFGRAVGEAVGLERIGLHVQRVPPGRRTSYPHAEADEEEFVFVLEGEIDAWIDGRLHRMRAGDLAGFPAGTGVCHSFLNNGERDALLLVGGEKTRPGNRIYYPLNPERRSEEWPEEWWDMSLDPQGDHDGNAGNRLGRAARAWADELVAGGTVLDRRRLTCWSFGDSAVMADELAALVIQGDKRATAGLLWTFEHTRTPVPEPGDPSIVTRTGGTPVCLIETTSCDVVPFSEVGADFAAAEGEGDRSLESWRAAHLAYFTRECAELGREPSGDMPVVCERFRLVRVK